MEAELKAQLRGSHQLSTTELGYSSNSAHVHGRPRLDYLSTLRLQGLFCTQTQGEVLKKTLHTHTHTQSKTHCIAATGNVEAFFSES